MIASTADACCMMLADEGAALLDQIAELEADVRIYRELGQQAIHQLHDLTRKHDHLRDQHYRLIDELRRLRGNLIRQAEAA